MANKVIFEVVATAKGVKVVQQQADKLAQSTDKADRSTKKLTKSRDRYNRVEKGTAGISSNSTKNFSKMQQSIDGGGGGGLVRAYALLAANVFAVTAAFGVLSRSAEIDILTNSMDRLSAVGGTSIKGITKDLVEASGGAIDFASGMRQVALASSAGISGDKINELATVARGASQALGRDMGDSLDRIFRGAIKLEPELLDEIGLFVRVDEASEKYAQTIGKTAGELTQFEKRQAFLNAVTEQGTRKFQEFADSVDPNVYSRLAASFADIAQSVLSFVNKALGPMIGFLVDNRILIVGLFSAVAFAIGKQVVPALGAFTSNIAASAAASAQEANEYIVDQERKLDAYQNFQKGVLIGQAKEQKDIARDKRGFTGKMFESTAKKGVDAEKNMIALQNTSLKGSERKAAVEDRITVLTKARTRASKANKKIIDEELLVRKAEVAALTQQKDLERQISLEGKNQLITTEKSIAARNQARLDNRAARATGLANVTGAGEVGGLRAGFGVLKDTLKSGKVEVDGVAKSLTGLNRVMFGVQGSAALLGQGIQKLFMIMGPFMMLIGLIAPFLPMIAKGMGITTKESKALKEATKALAEETGKLEEKFRIQNETRQKVNATLKQQRDSYIATNKTIVESLTNVIKLQQKIDDYNANQTLFQAWVTSSKLFKSESEKAFIETEQNIQKLVQQVAGSGAEVDNFFKTFSPDGIEQLSGNILPGAASEAERLGKRFNFIGNEISKNNEKIFEQRKIIRSTTASTEEQKAARGALDQLLKNQTSLENSQKKVRDAQLHSVKEITKEMLKQPDSAKELLGIVKEQLRAQQALASAIDGTKESALEFSTKFLPKTDVDAVTASFRQLATAAADTALSAEDEALLLKEIQDERGNIFALLNESNRKAAELAKNQEDVLAILKNQSQEYQKQQEILVIQKSQLKSLVSFQKELAKVSKLDSTLLTQDFEIQEKIRQSKISIAKISSDNARDQAKAETSQLEQLIAIENTEQRQAKIKELKLDVLKTEGAIGALLELQTLQRENAIKLATAEFEQEKIISQTLLERVNTMQKLTDARRKSAEMEMKINKVSRGLDSKLNPSEQAKFQIQAAQDKYDFELKTASLKMAVLDAENAILDARIEILVAEKALSKTEGDRIKNTLDRATGAQKSIIQEQVKQASLATSQALIDAISVAGLEFIEIGKNAAKAFSEGVQVDQQRVVEGQSKIESLQDKIKTGTAAGTMSNAERDEIFQQIAEESDKLVILQEKINADIKNITNSAARAIQDSAIKSLDQLGPEGKLVARVVEGIQAISDAFINLKDTMSLITDSFFGEDGKLLEGFTKADIAMAKAAATAEFAAQALSSIGQILAQNSTRQTAEIDRQIDAEKKRDGQSAASLAKIASLEKKKEAIAKKNFETQKKVQMAVTIANTAAGIMGAMAPPPIGLGPFGIGLAKMYAVMGALQLAVISRTSYGGGSGASAPEAPSTNLNIGKRGNTVDVSQKAGAGELAYLRNSRGVGTNANNFTPSAAMGRKGYANGDTGITVGERGPEVITSAAPIDIIPNYALGGGETNVNFNISAVDGASVQNMLNEQQGNIIAMIRQAANDNGEGFLESVDSDVYGGGG